MGVGWLVEDGLNCCTVPVTPVAEARIAVQDVSAADTTIARTFIVPGPGVGVGTPTTFKAKFAAGPAQRESDASGITHSALPLHAQTPALEERQEAVKAPAVSGVHVKEGGVPTG